MAESYKEREVRCYFGILNIKGLMDTDNKMVGEIEDYGQVRLPLFSHESYKIKTTFNKNLQYQDTFISTVDMNGHDITIKKPTSHFGDLHFADTTDVYQGKYYQKKFRRQVLWDFGDGTKIEGYSAEHAYRKPGRYRITCTFFDINRQAWVNNYCIYVVVKEVLPTLLRFVNQNDENTRIKCSKIQKIAQLEALVSNTVQKELNVNVKRIFSQKEHEDEYVEIQKKFDLIPKTPFRFMEKSWLFMENTQVLYYNSDKIYMNYIQPTDIFHPNYQNLYGKFYYNQQLNKIDFSFYQIIPFKNIDDKLKTITIIDPNERIIPDPNNQNQQEGQFYIDEKYKTYRITQLYVDSALPQDCSYVGKRGFFDIFYKNDFVSDENHVNTISIFYDIETENITGELKSAPNYLNINPLGLNIHIDKNNIDDIKIGISLDCFMRQVQDKDDYSSPSKDIIRDKNGIYNQKIYIDPHLLNTLIKGIDLDSFIFPYVPYGNSDIIIEDTELITNGDAEGWTPYNNAYYIPKDIILNIKDTRILHKGKGQASFINTGVQIDENGNIIDFGTGEVMQSVYPWLYRIPFIIRDYIDIILNIKYAVEGVGVGSELNARIKKIPTLNTNQVVIPKELQYKQNIERLLDVYMGHPMFAQTQNIRDMFKAFLSNNLLDSIMTRSKNFLDDTANIRSCYLSNLISTLKMMGEDVTQYEKSAFEGVNDLKNFVRLLSMNHGDLVGHVIYQDVDISISNDMKGKNVGVEIQVGDTLYLNNNQNSDHIGKIIGLQRKNNENKSKLLIEDNDLTKDGLELIVHDKYTHETKVVSLMQMQKNRLKSKQAILSDIRIQDYQNNWDWNLLLPDRFNNARKKQKEYAEKKLLVDIYSPTRRKFFQEEESRMKQICSDMINGYYSFYIFDPRRETKRVGNFIDDSYITDRIQDLKSWEEVWGITHQVLMKILFENGNLFNNRTFNIIEQGGEQQEQEEDNYITQGDIYLTREFDEGEIIYDLFINGKKVNDVKVGGSVILKGTILGEGSNTLHFSLENGLIDRYFPFTNYENNTLFEVNVNKNGTIDTNSKSFNIVGHNIQGAVTIKIKGTVSNPKMDVESVIYFIDDRVNPINVQIIKHYKTQFYTNIRRAQLDSSLLKSGLWNNTNDDSLNKNFQVSLRWDDNPKIGSNKIYISVDFNMGDLYYRANNTQSQAVLWGNDAFTKAYPYSVKDFVCYIIVEEDGSVFLAEEVQNQIKKVNSIAFDISSVGSPDNPVLGEVPYQTGKIYVVLSGNAMAQMDENKPKLNCYTYNPFYQEENLDTIFDYQNDVEQVEHQYIEQQQKKAVAQRLLVDVGGYAFKVTSKEENTTDTFTVDGDDGFAQGYYFIVNSMGHTAHSPFLYKSFWVRENVYIFNQNDELIKTLKGRDKTIVVSVDEHARITQDNYTNSYSDNNVVNIGVDGGYYELLGYKISVNTN